MGTDVRDPVILCGCHGGGTSFTTKLLRLQGLFCGADAGPLGARKYHESKTVMQINRELLRRMGITASGKTPQVRDEYRRFVDSGKTVEIGWCLDGYWGETAPYSCPWGWKDPRNAITLSFWKTKFPNARIVVVRKRRNPNAKSKSTSGHWFNHESTADTRAFYFHPPEIGAFRNVLFFDFDSLRPETFNALLAFCRLGRVTRQEYATLLKTAGFESS